VTAESPRNPVNLKKLPGSLWTAVRPSNREKHFIVIDWVRDEEDRPTASLIIEAVLTRSTREICWRELSDSTVWRIGWC
jgi:tryptophan-rich hypothetical protein